MGKRTKNWKNRKKGVYDLEEKECPECHRKLIMRKGRLPKCPVCRGAWFTVEGGVNPNPKPRVQPEPDGINPFTKILRQMGVSK